jgi:hypothetical protein
MKTLYYIMILVICLAPIAYSQVDTLEAIEVGTIQAPSNISQLYMQDLNGDSLKELILCTSNHIYAYNQADSIPFWISPELVRPTDLQFADIDGDSLLDVSVKDSANISFFNVSSSSLIYTAETDNLYRLYTIGDANGDGFYDLATVRQENDAAYRQDTVWVKICYGPEYSTFDSLYFLIINYSFYEAGYDQSVNVIKIVSLGPSNDRQRRLILASQYEAGSDGYLEDGGRIWMYDIQNYNVVYSDAIGRREAIELLSLNDNAILITSIYKYYASISHYPIHVQCSHKIAQFGPYGLLGTTTMTSVDTSIGYHPIYYGWQWSYSAGEQNPNNNGTELCFAFADWFKEYSLLDGSAIWAQPRPADSVTVMGTYNSPLFPSPEILLKEIRPTQQYLFINGVNPQINTILPNVIPSISNISDLNHDGNDEILSISGNTLHIYNLDWATPVAEKPIMPSEYLAVSNYPNPFNGQTIIKYNLPRQSAIVLEIYDILGRKIESIEKLNQPAGLGQITWDASSEPSGVYFYRLSAGNEQKTGRMVLLK